MLNEKNSMNFFLISLRISLLILQHLRHTRARYTVTTYGERQVDNNSISQIVEGRDSRPL